MQQDPVIKTAAVKPQSVRNNVEHMMEIWRLFVSCIHLRTVTHRSDVLLCCCFPSLQWSGGFSGCLSRRLQVRHDLFTRFLLLGINLSSLSQAQKPFLGNILCFRSAHKNRRVEQHQH